jgi:hypothetical protein
MADDKAVHILRPESSSRQVVITAAVFMNSLQAAIFSVSWPSSVESSVLQSGDEFSRSSCLRALPVFLRYFYAFFVLAMFILFPSFLYPSPLS